MCVTCVQDNYSLPCTGVPTTVMVNVAADSPLVLECEGPAQVTWENYTQNSNQSEVITSPSNNAGEQRSWLVYRNGTYSDSIITCKTSNGNCLLMNYSVMVFSK